MSRAPGVVLISFFYKNSLPILVYSELLNFVREPGFKGVGRGGEVLWERMTGLESTCLV